MKRKRLSLIVALFLLAALVGWLNWFTNATIRQENLNRDLIAAIKENNTRKTLTLLDEGADPNARDVPQVQPSFLQMLRMLLHRHDQDTDQPTALMLALGVRVELDTNNNSTAMSGSPDKDNLQIVQALCDHGVDVNGRSTWGYTPLMAAAFAEAPPSIVKLLLDRGANVNARDIRGQTALMQAAGNWNAANVRLLLAHGADVNAKDKQESTALLETVRETEDSPSTNTDGAIRRTLEVLMDHGAGVNDQDDAGMTALMHLFLSTDGETDACEHLLIERGAIIHLKNRQGETALVYAVARGHTNAVKTLLLKGADPNARRYYSPTNRPTALMVAVGHGYAQIVKLLIEHGANIHAMNGKGITVMWYARMPRTTFTAQRDYARIQQLLNQAGAKK